MKFDKTKETAAAALHKALGHPTRIWIVRQLAQQEHCVSEFVEALGVEFATVSRHLAKLKRVGVIVSRKKGREIWYGLNRPKIDQVFASFG